MKREEGSIDFPIWLLGDSNPQRWADSLSGPLDPRHPVRHNIWTPILDEIQDSLFRAERTRLDSSQIYVRNAVAESDIKPKPNALEWGETLEGEYTVLGDLAIKHSPAMLFSFGSFAFEFARRALLEQPIRPFYYWNTRKLGEEFRRRLDEYSDAKPNIIPLLHRSISGGHFMSGHQNFCGRAGANYFQDTGQKVAKKILEQRHVLPIWI